MTAIELRVAARVGELGPEWDALFEAGPGLQTKRQWFAASVEAALPRKAEPQFLAFSDVDGPLALFPMLALGNGMFQSLTTPYTCIYQPLLRPGASAASLEAAMAGFARHCRRWPVTRLEALDPGWAGLTLLRRGFASGRLISRKFSHFANWSASIPSGSWDAYLQARPGALRETIRRKMRAVERQPEVRFEVACSGPALVRSLAAYERVYAKSWKDQEPFPAFNTALIRHLAQTEGLRMFILWHRDEPVAAQYWTLIGGSATVLKLAHDEAFKPLSPGTVLTAHAIRHFIESEGISDLDFGRGDDPYKRAWAETRRVRLGLLALNPMTVTGVRVLVRHDLGRARRFFVACSRRSLWQGRRATAR